MLQDKFHISGKRLSSYALACGYVEGSERNSISVTLWREHGVYHVRVHDHGQNLRKFWYVFPKLADARKAFAAGCRYQARKEVTP